MESARFSLNKLKNNVIWWAQNVDKQTSKLRLETVQEDLAYLHGIKAGNPEQARWAHAPSSSQSERRNRFICPRALPALSLVMLFLLGDWSIKDNREWFLNFPWHFVAWYYFFSWVERGLLGVKCWTSSGARFSIESSPHRFPPSLPFPPPSSSTHWLAVNFGEKWRGRGGGFIFIIRKDGYRSIKLFPWKKKKTPMTPKGSCLETTRFHANSLIMRLVWPSSSKIFHLFLIQFNSFARCLPLYTASLLVSP